MFFGQMDPRTHILDNYSVEHRFDGWIKNRHWNEKTEKFWGVWSFAWNFWGL